MPNDSQTVSPSGCLVVLKLATNPELFPTAGLIFGVESVTVISSLPARESRNAPSKLLAPRQQKVGDDSNAE